VDKELRRWWGGLRRRWGREKVSAASWEAEDRLGARLDHDLELQVKEWASAARAVWPPYDRGKGLEEAAWVDGFCILI
jgi:hypothetical protein